MGTKGLLGTGDDYGLLVDLEEVAAAVAAAITALHQRHGRYVVASNDFYWSVLEPFDFEVDTVDKGVSSLSDDLEEGTEILEQDDEDRQELVVHTLAHLAGLLAGLAYPRPRSATDDEIDRITALR